MRESSVVISGLARDVRLYLPRVAARLERLGQMFEDYRVVLYENDSIDATREFLQDWQAKNPRVTVLGGRLGAPHYPSSRSVDRTSWLARCRNEYRNYLLGHLPDVHFVVVVDTDLAGGFSYDGLAHTLAQNDWDVVGSLGLYERLGTALPKPHFAHADLWAFRPADAQAADELAQKLSSDPTRGKALVPVDSAFGGLAVYRREVFVAAPYGGEDCEHVVFHNHLRAAGFSRQFLSPNQLVLYTPLG